MAKNNEDREKAKGYVRVGIQWNLRMKDTLGQGVLSFIERFPLFGGYNVLV